LLRDASIDSLSPLPNPLGTLNMQVFSLKGHLNLKQNRFSFSFISESFPSHKESKFLLKSCMAG